MDADQGSTDRSKTEGPAHGVFGSCLSRIYALGLAQRSEPLSAFEGRCRVTTIDPKNQCEIVDFGPGDVRNFPRGYGHSIQG